jgi:hypothetical protein
MSNGPVSANAEEGYRMAALLLHGITKCAVLSGEHFRKSLRYQPRQNFQASFEI